MPLVDLKTNLKSLRYGNDQRGGGNSGQPYITTDIPDQLSDIDLPQGVDTFLRNGRLYGQSANDDFDRIEAFLNSPLGENWILKQEYLSRQSTWRFPLSLPVSQIYRKEQTLKQVELKTNSFSPDGGPWIHIYKQGGLSLPSLGYLNPLNYGNAYKVADQAGINRLTNLYRSKVSVFGSTGAAIAGAATSVLLGVSPGNTSIPGSDLLLQAYYGGTDTYGGQVSIIPRTTFSTNKAKSFGGQGTTRLARLLSGGTGQNVITFDQDVLGNLSLNNTSNLTPLQILDRNISSILSPTTFIYGPNSVNTYQDFRQTIKTQSSTSPFATDLASTDYRAFNREKTYKTGNPGIKDANKSNPYQAIPTGSDGIKDITADRITLTPLYTSNSVNNEDEQSDLIKFTISVVDNDDPSQRTWITFRAFIDSFGDSFNASWNEYKYVGRGESFYRYGGFGRSISLAFKAAVQSRQEQFPLYQKLNYLASLTAPDYSGNGFMRGNLVYLTIGDWLVDVPGVLKGMSLGIPNESPWEIARDRVGARQKDIAQLPFIVEVSGFDFAPIHNFVPRKNAPFIGAPVSGSQKNYFAYSPPFELATIEESDF
jgi:hypothetical protein